MNLHLPSNLTTTCSSPEAINLDEANRVKRQGIINSEPLALVEYWAVDPATMAHYSAQSGKIIAVIPTMMATRCGLPPKPSSPYPRRLATAKSACGQSTCSALAEVVGEVPS